MDAEDFEWVENCARIYRKAAVAASFAYGVFSEMVEGPMNEDGERRILFSWYVVAEELSSGRRWAHFFTDVTYFDEESPRARRLCDRIKAARPDPRGSCHWSETRPNYCSDAARILEREEAFIERRDHL